MDNHRDTENTEKKLRIADCGLRIKSEIRNPKSEIVSLCLCGYIVFAAAVSAAPVMVPVDGEPFVAELAGVGDGVLKFRAVKEDSPVAAATSPVVELKVEDLVRWGHPTLPRPQAFVLLADGSRLVTSADWSGGAAVQVEDETVVVRSDSWDDVRVPRALVAGLVFAHRDHVADRQRLEDTVRADRGEKDIVLLTNRDRVSGKLTKLAGGSLVIDVDGRETKLPLSRVAGVVFAKSNAPGGSAQPRPQPPEIIVGMRDGSLLVAQAIRPDGDGVTVELASGTKLAGGAVEDVAAIQGLGDEKFVYLSDREPADYKHVPYLNIEWPYARDRNVLGGPLTIGGERYVKGIGMHSAARLTYRLDGKYRRFDAAAALDDSSRGRGSVTFGVYLLRDGQWKQAATSEVVRGGAPPENVSVDVKGAEAMTLVVDFADRGDELDYADWLDARLIKN
jgi:hypothetical protein